MAGGVSLKDGSAGGFLDDTEAVIKSCKTGEYTYTTGQTTNALIVTLDAGLDEPHIEAYSSGAALPTDDGTGFQSVLSLKSKAKMFIDSLIKLDYPNVEADVRVFEGAKVHLKRSAMPKMPGLDKAGERDKTVLLVDKIIALPSATGAKRPTAGSATKATPPKAATATGKQPPATSTASASANGSGDEAAIAAVQEALAKQDGATMQIGKLQTSVFLAALKAKMPSAEATALKKTVTPEWLVAQAEAGGWTTNGEEVGL
jgi:hypothetical protein